MLVFMDQNFSSSRNLGVVGDREIQMVHGQDPQKVQRAYFSNNVVLIFIKRPTSIRLIQLCILIFRWSIMFFSISNRGFRFGVDRENG